MEYSSSLTDKEWEIIEPLLPKKKKTRPPIWSKRQILDGIFYQLKNGCNWCDLPKDLPPYSTVFWHYKHWRTDGVLAKIMYRTSCSSPRLDGTLQEFSQKLRAHPQPCDCQDRSVFYPFDAQTALISTRLKIDPKWVL
jgi:hypothetical protein